MHSTDYFYFSFMTEMEREQDREGERFQAGTSVESELLDVYIEQTFQRVAVHMIG